MPIQQSGSADRLLGKVEEKISIKLHPGLKACGQHQYGTWDKIEVMCLQYVLLDCN